jgi:hypothetical protein
MPAIIIYSIFFENELKKIKVRNFFAFSAFSAFGLP